MKIHSSLKLLLFIGHRITLQRRLLTTFRIPLAFEYLWESSNSAEGTLGSKLGTYGVVSSHWYPFSNNSRRLLVNPDDWYIWLSQPSSNATPSIFASL
jgi:hypothetical protein